jgi:hypothetical protein
MLALETEIHVASYIGQTETCVALCNQNFKLKFRIQLKSYEISVKATYIILSLN